MSEKVPCVHCGEIGARGPVIKVLRGSKHVFCSESCYVLYRFNVPPIDRLAIYEKAAINRKLGDAAGKD